MGLIEPAASGMGVRLAVEEDLPRLGIIGPAAYAEAYSYLWASPDAYARHLATFGAVEFGRLLKRPEAQVLVAEFEGEIVGFLSLVLGSMDPVEGRPSGAEIPRIYLLGPARERGLGRQLVDAAASLARSAGASYLWLDVMASAAWARRAYVRLGFRESGAGRFDAGVRADLDQMFVLVKDL